MTAGFISKNINTKINSLALNSSGTVMVMNLKIFLKLAPEKEIMAWARKKKEVGKSVRTIVLLKEKNSELVLLERKQSDI